MTGKTFMKITNKDIYDKLEGLIAANQTQHAQILIHQKETNGKVKLNRWIATTALSLFVASFTAIGIIIKLN